MTKNTFYYKNMNKYAWTSLFLSSVIQANNWSPNFLSINQQESNLFGQTDEKTLETKQMNPHTKKKCDVAGCHELSSLFEIAGDSEAGPSCLFSFSITGKEALLKWLCPSTGSIRVTVMIMAAWQGQTRAYIPREQT